MLPNFRESLDLAAFGDSLRDKLSCSVVIKVPGWQQAAVLQAALVAQEREPGQVQGREPEHFASVLR